MHFFKLSNECEECAAKASAGSDFHISLLCPEKKLMIFETMFFWLSAELISLLIILNPSGIIIVVQVFWIAGRHLDSQPTHSQLLKGR